MSLTEQDQVELGRVAHQLEIDHGLPSAYLYAARLAREAAAEGKFEEAEFWSGVSAALKPRTSG